MVAKFLRRDDLTSGISADSTCTAFSPQFTRTFSLRGYSMWSAMATRCPPLKAASKHVPGACLQGGKDAHQSHGNSAFRNHASRLCRHYCQLPYRPLPMDCIQAALAETSRAKWWLSITATRRMFARRWKAWRRPAAPDPVDGHGNVGFARACNLGAEATTSPYLLLLNPDNVLQPGSLDGAMANSMHGQTSRLRSASRIRTAASSAVADAT